MEVKVSQACALTGCLKVVSYITPPMPRCIVKDPRQVLPSSYSAKQAPQGFIEWQSPCLPIFRLIQPDKSVEHIHQVPSEAEQFPFSHAGMECRHDNEAEGLFTGLE